jgi:hypothetical protein
MTDDMSDIETYSLAEVAAMMVLPPDMTNGLRWRIAAVRDTPAAQPR